MAHDLKARNIQVEEIQSVKPDSVSGDMAITVDAKLRYTEGFILDDDYDLVYKSYIDSMGGGFTYFTDNSNAAIAVNLSTGEIVIADVATNFPVISDNGIIRLQCDCLIGGVWLPSDVFPDYTTLVKDGSGFIISCSFFTGQTDITTIRGRIQ